MTCTSCKWVKIPDDPEVTICDGCQRTAKAGVAPPKQNSGGFTKDHRRVFNELLREITRQIQPRIVYAEYATNRGDNYWPDDNAGGTIVYHYGTADAAASEQTITRVSRG